jgi:CheY-like chemotaxis protein
MPGMNGADVAREMQGRRPALPILFATGYADAEALAAASDDRIVHKPFKQGELADKLALAFAS